MRKMARLLLSFGLALSLSACGTEGSTSSEAEVLKSVVPVPRSWDSAGLQEAYAAAAELGSFISLPDPVDWFDAQGKRPEDSKQSREFAVNDALIKQNGLQVLIQLDPYPGRKGLIPNLPATVVRKSFGDPVLRRAYAADALNRVRLYHPPYLCLAMEINAYYEQHPEDFENFVTLFKEIRTKIKAESPNTLVFVSFQYEQFLGLFGGQAGLPVHPPHWELFDRFGADLDAIGISTYPMDRLGHFPDPSALPENYFSRIADHSSKPIIFTEIGWPSSPSLGGSPEFQAAFVSKLDTLTANARPLLANWFMLSDNNAFGQTFESMGLIAQSGTPKTSFESWKRLWLSH